MGKIIDIGYIPIVFIKIDWLFFGTKSVLNPFQLHVIVNIWVLRVIQVTKIQ